MTTLGSNLGLCDERPTTNVLNYCTALPGLKSLVAFLLPFLKGKYFLGVLHGHSVCMCMNISFYIFTKSDVTFFPFVSEPENYVLVHYSG